MATSKYLAPQALGETLEDLRKHATTSFGVAALISLPVPFLAVYAAVRPTYLSTTAQTVVGTIAAWWVAYALILATKQYAGDSDPGVSGALKQSRTGLVRYGLTRIVLGIVIVLAVVAAVVVGAFILGFAAPDLFSTTTPSAGSIAAAALVIGPLVILAILVVYLRFGLAPVASGLEQTRPVASLKRSSQVTRGHRVDFLVLLFIIWVFTVIVQILVQGPAQMVTNQPGTLGGVDIEELSFDEFLEDAMQLPEPVGPPAAVIIGISTYMSLIILETFIAGLSARFFMALTKPQEDEPPALEPDSDSRGQQSSG